ncbi:AMP-binding protein [Rhodococcus wratislaviensis]|uniref:AMP-binding protein n=1 Tax=Rhodococcus wratislaviensis TaxID=44752 RepID=UPI0036695F67
MIGPGICGTPDEPAWNPPAEVVERSRLLGAATRWGYADLAAVHRASVDDQDGFWRAALDDLGVELDGEFDVVRDDADGREFPRWFPGARVNAATLCALRHAEGALAGKVAVVYEADNGRRRQLTYAELADRVRWLAAHLARLGVVKGDRVVLFMPVVPEATVAYLACGMIGAISVPAFSGYGPDALAARLADSGAKVLITADGTTRRGAAVPLKVTADAAMKVDGAEPDHVIVVRNIDTGVEMRPGRDIYYDELAPDPVAVAVADTEANDPLTIVYTSGTTGRPKGIVHSHGGFCAKAALDFGYGFDIHADDVIAWIADMGWLLGPLLITGGLQLGATIVLTEGVPTYPTPGRVWEIVERNAVTFQGIAPTAARAMKASDHEITADLASLRTFASTGEPWDDSTWRWLFAEVGEEKRPIVNYSGGTEVGGGVAISYPFLPMEPASFNAPMLGADVAVLDQDGKPVAGEIGELSIMNTFPGMTHSFWQDPERYLETYWKRWPGVWVHGDLASVNGSGTWRVHGRSDDTIKVSGRRVGPGEIEAAILLDRRVAESAVVGVPDDRRGQRAVAFVVLRPDVPAADHGDLAAVAEKNVGRSFAPSVHVVPSLPKTKNGKVMRRAIRSQYLGLPQGDLSSLDPATPIEAIPALG